jgi:hypothetical protein
MPSKSAKQHRFMEAIAHNPAFAKKAGVSQSVGKEFAAADKGKKFVRGGINKQDTHHGKMDMPFNKLNRHAGMKSGGFMKKKIRKFAEGGANNPPDVPAQEYSEAAEKFLGKADRTDPFIISRMKKAVPDYEKRTRAPVEDREVSAAAPATPARAEPAVSSENISGYGEREESVKTNEGPQGRMEDLKVPVRTSRPAARPTRPAVKPGEDKFISNEGGAATGMTRKGGQLARLAEKSRGLTDEEKEEAGKRAGLAVAGFAAGAAGPALLGGAARLGQGAYQAGRGAVAAQRARHAASAAKAGETTSGTGSSLSSSMADNKAARAYEALKNSGAVKSGDGPNQLIARAGQSGAENVSKGAQRLRAQRQKMTKGEKLSDAEAGMKKGGMTKRFAAGGMMKESKAMVGKEVAFMKKKGAPKSMIKHEAAEMGAMKKGGMAKYARGGGIESRGKTKGTVIKMATGGVVGFARGGGIESKGKTKGTMIKMKGC